MYRPIIVSILLSLPGVCGAAIETGLEVRLLAEVIPNDLGQVVLANLEARSDPFNLPMNNLSPPQKPPARVFSVWSVGKNASMANVKLPEEGKSFIVLLLMSPDGGGYKPIVMAAGNTAFKGGDVYFHNNANKTVLGILGKTSFSLAPGEGKILTPSGFGDEKYYHVMLGVREAGENKVIKSMKWPSSKTMRNYVFFYVDARKSRVTFRAVDEFVEKIVPAP
jgi:hypothetical protein